MAIIEKIQGNQKTKEMQYFLNSFLYLHQCPVLDLLMF